MPSRWSRILPALPSFHFMAFAPLDAWWRLLTQDRAYSKIPPRYALRILGGVGVSAFATILTLPERLLLAPILASRYRAHRGPHPITPLTSSPAHSAPPILIVLGYYRSGTTHLHYLLSCDQNFVTPRWYQMLMPQGFALSWTLLRYFLVPFLSSTRPQDDVAYGSEYPAEDDFGVCNWSVSCAMPGRMVLPGCWDFYSRFHTLEGLSPAERERFLRAQHGLTWKLQALNPRRGVLFKTPSHTARVRALTDLYGDRVKFIHLHRDPTPVLRSNVAMHRRFEPFLFQDHPGDDEIRRRIIAEYDATERAFLADAASLPDSGRGVIAGMRYEDLIADPLGQLRRAYTELNIPFTPEFESRAAAYLESVGNYRSAAERTKTKSDDRDQIPPAPELDWMLEAFGHDRPPLPAVTSPERSEGAAVEGALGPSLRSGLVAALLAALWALSLWLLIAYFTANRFDALIWPTGIAIGLAALKSAKRGTLALGLWAGFLTFAVLLAVAYPVSWITEYRTRSPVPWDHVFLSAKNGLLAWNNVFWAFLGVVTAFRFASREHVRPPGL